MQLTPRCALRTIELVEMTSAMRTSSASSGWGYSDVGSFGSEIATPSIDMLARQLGSCHQAVRSRRLEF